MKDNKEILDVCCGGKMMYFNKNHPEVLFCDIREEEKGFINGAEWYSVKPDKICDFRNLPFKDKSFNMVVFDPPHIVTNCKSGILVKKFGSLNKETWQYDLKKGFNECWRVLKDNGTLIFKFAETKNIPFREILKVIDREPLFGTKNASTKNSETRFFVFYKQ